MKFIYDKNNNKYKRTVFAYPNPKNINGHTREILCLDISHDGKFLITSGKDSIIKIWDLQNNKFIHDLKSHRSFVTTIKFKKNSYECVSGSYDHSIRIWDVQQKGMIQDFYGHKS